MSKLVTGFLSITLLIPLALLAGVGVTEAAAKDVLTAPLAGSPADISQEVINRPVDPSLVIPDQAVTLSPELQAFVDVVHTGQADVLTGVFVDQAFSMPVVQQPKGQAGFISSTDGTVTDFRLARNYGSTGLIAHNYLGGKLFDQFTVGQTLYLVYGDSEVVAYSVVRIDRYQALSPNSPYSDFVNLDEDEGTISAEDLFYKMYGQEEAVVFQTCIEQDGNSTWGRLFITAVPLYYFPDVGMAVDPQ